MPTPRMRSTVQRGYGAEHKRSRKQWEPKVAAGTVTCWRCGQRIHPLEQWDLGHDDNDRRITRGPEHARRCNRAAAARKTNAIRRAKSTTRKAYGHAPVRSRTWL